MVVCVLRLLVASFVHLSCGTMRNTPWQVIVESTRAYNVSPPHLHASRILTRRPICLIVEYEIPESTKINPMYYIYTIYT